MSDKNQLYFGDNLDVRRRYVADESVDLVYLDPPFNSNANYNVLFKEHDGAEAADTGFYESPWGKHPQIQHLTVSELLKGDHIDMPPATGVNVTFKRAPRSSRKGAETGELSFQREEK